MSYFHLISLNFTSRKGGHAAVCALLCAASVALVFPAAAQTIYSEAYNFTTFAGIARAGSLDGVGIEAQFNSPNGVAEDHAGNLYVADDLNCTIRKITPAGVVTTLAGLAGFQGSADGTGKTARFSNPHSVAVDGSGNCYVADTGNHTIREVTPAGVVTTLAGLPGNPGSADGTGSAARFSSPAGVAVDSAGNIYVADSVNETIREILPVSGTSNWVVSTIAGLAGASGSTNGTGGAARFSFPSGLSVDKAGNLLAVDSTGLVYVADFGNSLIRKITPVGATWVVSTLAGQAGVPNFADGTGTNAQFFFPEGVAVDAAGNIYVADGASTIRKVTPAGVVTTLAGQPVVTGNGNGVGNAARFYFPADVAVDNAGNVFVADTGNNAIREITPAGQVSTVAGEGITSYGGADGAGTGARLDQPWGVATDTNGDVFVADTYNFTIRKITPAGLVSTVAGSAGSLGTNDGVGDQAQFGHSIPFNGSISAIGPQGLAVDSAGNIFVADTGNNTIRKITPPGVVTTIAGLAGFTGSANGTGSTARFNNPWGVAVDTAGNVYVADNTNNTIRKLAPVKNTANWNTITIAGLAGAFGSTDGTNSAARFNSPAGLAADTAGNLYVADTGNYTIRKLTPVTGTTNWVTSTIAGLAGFQSYSDGTNAAARFADPQGIAVDSAGNLFVTESGSVNYPFSPFDFTIRKITLVGTNRVVSTIGGSLVGNFVSVVANGGSADGAGNAALFLNPRGVAVDGSGNVYVADTGNNTIRKGVFNAYTSANIVSFSPPANTATLVVTLLPPEANGLWRFPWELAWRQSGTAATNLVPNVNYPVQFSPVPGYLPVPAVVTNFVAGGATNYVTNQYYPTLTPLDLSSGGSLTVSFQNGAPGGAGWRLLGSTNAFLPSGFTTNLLQGNYLIEFAALSNFVQIPILSVQISAGLPATVQEIYQPSQPPPPGFLLPQPVPSGQISDLADYPYGYNGRLETDVGYGSGVAVGPNVVLTAAHLVFNDQTLSYVSQVWWYPQENAPQFVPEPQPAVGWLVLSGYAAQRSNDLNAVQGILYAPDQSSPPSRNFDVAALYFLSSVAGGAYGGFLPSDAVPNTWLTSTANKMLVGYPVDGSMFQAPAVVPGKMYEIGPQPYQLTLDPDAVNDQQVYTATWFLSYPGNSGGPLYVQLNGSYYPAAVYLGTLVANPYASAVRAIDSNVVNLITNAQAVVTTGVNNSGGGVVTIIPGLTTSKNNPGYLILQLGPPAAVQAGASWKLASQPASDYSTASPSVQEVTDTNALVVQFKPIPGWNLPTNRAVTVVPGLILTNLASYTVTNPVLTVDLVNGLWISGTTNTKYQIQSNSSLTNIWVSFKTNTLTNFNFNLITNQPRPAYYRAIWLP